MTGAKERKENIEGLEKSLSHVAVDVKHVFNGIIQTVGHLLAVVVACGTAVIDTLKAVANGLSWAGSGVVGATKDLMHEHSNMTHESGQAVQS